MIARDAEKKLSSARPSPRYVSQIDVPHEACEPHAVTTTLRGGCHCGNIEVGPRRGDGRGSRVTSGESLDAGRGPAAVACLLVSAFLAILVVVVVLVIQASVRNASAGSYDRLASRGARGRALVLASSQMAVGVTIGRRRFQRRQMRLEIEVEGGRPYEVTDTFLVPRGLIEPIPGSSLDVAVDSRKPSQIAVLGPGGFSGPWLTTGVPQPY
jgi:hypothetical protein